MGIPKGKTEGGQGGKRGHSNMDHWMFTEEVKEAARKRRRLNAKVEVREELAEFHVTGADKPESTDEFSE